MRRSPIAFAVLALATPLVGCGDEDEAAGPKATSVPTATKPAEIDGKFDVGGHKLY